ncbi:hypothetical protein [Sodalinema gerasimenkoae]|uniref:hypothetical protein n=1 Tax=Sodalinema gerasimenkoae TaxID=2862348 RepID=UPI001CA48DD5|nr:hypothetical protein [Sodalinema gerasimenkoae]
MNAKLNSKKKREAMANPGTTKGIKRQEAIALLQSHRAGVRRGYTVELQSL